jgi:hypothetical protein
MKTPHQSKLSEALFRHGTGEQPVRLIKAAQAGKLLGALNGNGHAAGNGAAEVHKKPEIRMIHAGAEYCDLEIVCGCGESTQVRCWNTAVAEQKAAA